MRTIGFDKKIRDVVVLAAEFSLMALIGAAIAAYAWHSVSILFSLDWSQSATFEEFVQRVLLLLIGLELILVVRVHSVRDLFLVAVLALFRKALDPATATATVVSLLAASLVIVVAINALARKGVIGLEDPL